MDKIKHFYLVRCIKVSVTAIVLFGIVIFAYYCVYMNSMKPITYPDCSDEFVGLISHCNETCIGTTTLSCADLVGDFVVSSIEIGDVNSLEEAYFNIQMIRNYYDRNKEFLPHNKYDVSVLMHNDLPFWVYFKLDSRSNNITYVQLSQDNIPDDITTEEVLSVMEVNVSLNLESDNLTDDDLLILEKMYPRAIICADYEEIVGWCNK